VELFETIDAGLWEKSEGNPIALLDMLSLKKYQELEKDEKFLDKLESVYAQFSRIWRRRALLKG
jgi:glycogen phosphorylase/synthase